MLKGRSAFRTILCSESGAVFRFFIFIGLRLARCLVAPSNLLFVEKCQNARLLPAVAKLNECE
eukprot:765116-Hanusia_phi.AAC.6